MSRVTVVLRVDARAVTSETYRHGRLIRTATVGTQSATLAESVRLLVDQAAGLGRVGAVEALIESPPLQRRTLLELPPVSERALKEMIAHRAPQLFRVNGHPLITDACWITGTGGRRVAAGVALDSVVALGLLEAVAKAAGARVLAIRPAPEGLRHLSLLPGSEVSRRRQDARRGLLRLGTWVALAWTLLLGGIWIRRVLEHHRLTQRLEQMRPLRESLLAARRSLDSTQAMFDAMRAADRDRLQLAADLLTLSRALPDSTYLTSVDFARNGAGEIQGASTHALAALAAAQRTTGVPRPELKSPPTRDGVPAGYERFTWQLGGGGRP